MITLGNARFRCPEVLFQPSRLGLDHDGIHRLVYNTFTRCELEISRDFLHNIVLSGGTTMLSHLDERLKNELEALL